MFNNVHNYLLNKYNTSIKILKGKQTIKTDKQYLVYNLILFYHNCKSTNRIDRLIKKYNSDKDFKLLVDYCISEYEQNRITP
jgi:uncharacterized Fe-S cluster-containing MiaB family protein